MSELMANVLNVYLPVLSQGFLAVSMLATIIVKLTPTDKDDILVDGIKTKVLKLIAYLPTLGVNPRTQALEAALKDLSEKK